MYYARAAALAVLGIGLTSTANAANILFILDASGSMWGQVEGKSKIDIAKGELAKLLEELPPDTQVGLMVYGHRSKTDCQDVELTVPIGSASQAEIASSIQGLTPLGKTPIGYALTQSAAAFASLKGQNNNVVLISDGVESCDADPCDAASKLASAEIGVRAHVIGFDLTAEENARLKCIADNGNGQYFSANSTGGFSDAIGQALEVAQAEQPAPAPEPQPPVEQPKQVIFSDEFEGAELSTENWEVKNPNPDSYIVENGSLLTISSSVGGIDNPDLTNVFQLKQELPSSDYEVTIKLQLEFATGAERVTLGLFENPENYIAATLGAHYDRYGPDWIEVLINKLSQGQATGFSARTMEASGTGYEDPAAFDADANALGQPITLKLIKEGREFRASANFAGQKDENGNPVWITTEPVSSLRPPSTLVLATSQSGESGGESTFMVDSVTIEAPGG